MENKYKKGEVVFERIYPSKKLIVCSYTDGMYYCKDRTNLKGKAFVYFERELKTDKISDTNNDPGRKTAKV